MTNKKNEAAASIFAELQLYHAALGAGYNSPFPIEQCLVFASAMDNRALATLGRAEAEFRGWHEDSVKSERAALAAMEEGGGQFTGGMPQGGNLSKVKIKELKDKLSGIPNITWKEENATKSSLTEITKRSFYHAVTYIDPVGARLAAALTSSPAALSRDLALVTLTGHSTDETLIRAGATGGSLIHSLAGTETSFNYFSNCHSEVLEKLSGRISTSLAGKPAVGSTVLIPGRVATYTGLTQEVLLSLMKRVYVLGKEPAEQRVNVIYCPKVKQQWEQFLTWDLEEIADHPAAFTEWERQQLADAPASPRTCVMAGARAALVLALVEVASANPTGSIKCVELTADHLAKAQQFAKLTFEQTSGIQKLRKRLDNLKSDKRSALSLEKINKGREVLAALIEAGEGRATRRKIRDTPGISLAVLDKLVNDGEIVEIAGPVVNNAKTTGGASRVYINAADAPPIDPGEAMDEFLEALEEFQEDEGSITTKDAYSVMTSLQEKAHRFNTEEFLPVVPLSHMSLRELKTLPRIIKDFGETVLLRGVGEYPDEPSNLIEDEECPLDVEGLNLWVRYKPDGRPFRDSWQLSTGLELQDVWCEDIIPPPEDNQ